jgi:hypothetical protein
VALLALVSRLRLATYDNGSAAGTTGSFSDLLVSDLAMLSFVGSQELSTGASPALPGRGSTQPLFQLQPLVEPQPSQT